MAPTDSAPEKDHPYRRISTIPALLTQSGVVAAPRRASCGSEPECIVPANTMVVFGEILESPARFVTSVFVDMSLSSSAFSAVARPELVDPRPTTSVTRLEALWPTERIVVRFRRGTRVAAPFGHDQRRVVCRSFEFP